MCLWLCRRDLRSPGGIKAGIGWETLYTIKIGLLGAPGLLLLLLLSEAPSTDFFPQHLLTGELQTLHTFIVP